MPFLLRNFASVLLFGAFLVACEFLTPTISCAQWELTPQQNSKLEQYIREIQTEPLLVEHLESAVAKDKNIKTRRTSAKRLLTLYAQNMMSGRKTAGINWRKKSELLLATYPELESLTIRLAILQAKYVEAETDFQTWWTNGQLPSKRSELTRQWRTLPAELLALNQNLEEEYQDQITTAQSQSRSPDSQALIKTESLLLHTNYLLGWSQYFLGVLDPAEQKAFMKEADKHFRKFLEIEPQKALSTIDPTWFDFSSQWQLRSFVGLAMTQRGRNYPNQAKFCFDMIESYSPTQSEQDRRHIWELNSHLYLGEHTDALELAQAFLKDGTKNRSGRVAYWQAAVDAGTSLRLTAPFSSTQFLRLGLVGLTRHFEGAAIQRFFDSYDVQFESLFPDAEQFEGHWVKGFLKFYQAELAGGLQNYKDAKTALVVALALSGETDSPNLDQQRCRFLIAKIDHRLQNFDSAAQAFLQVSKSFDKVDKQLAAESQWLATRSLIELSKRNPREQIKANRALDEIVRRFPGSTYATRAEFENLRVNIANMQPKDALKRLSNVEPNSLNYPVALNEMVKLRYKIWLGSFEARSEDTAQRFKDLEQSELDYRSLSNASDTSKVKSSLLVVDAMLRSTRPDKLQIRQRLDNIKQLATRQSVKIPSQIEYRYYEFLFANSNNDTDEADRQAIWISENGQGTRFERSALVQLAQTADQQFRSLAKPNSEQKTQLISIFERLTDVLGKTPEIISASPNARIALSRLADLKMQAGQTKESLELLTFLNQTFPNNKSYLHQLGRGLTRTESFKQAVPVWRKLASGVDPGTELWFESKYELANSLLQSGDKVGAKSLHEQTRLLSPNLPDKWKEPFDDLTHLLEK